MATRVLGQNQRQRLQNIRTNQGASAAQGYRQGVAARKGIQIPQKLPIENDPITGAVGTDVSQAVTAQPRVLGAKQRNRFQNIRQNQGANAAQGYRQGIAQQKGIGAAAQEPIADDVVSLQDQVGVEEEVPPTEDMTPEGEAVVEDETLTNAVEAKPKPFNLNKATSRLIQRFGGNPRQWAEQNLSTMQKPAMEGPLTERQRVRRQYLRQNQPAQLKALARGQGRFLIPQRKV